eukprot:g12247.t1
MSTITPKPGATNARQEALDRVDSMLRALSKDKLLQEDLRHPDVRKAMEHWTGHNRLSQDDADELMEDNFRIQSVCDKMAQLQSLCKQASIGLPLSHVIAGKGLYEQLPQAGAGQATGSSPGTSGQAASGTSTGQEDAVRRRKGTATSGLNQPTKPLGAAAAAVDGGVEKDDPSWRQALLEEVLRLTGVAMCALVFTVLLKHFRGEDPLGKGLSGEGGAGALSGQDEL